MFRECVVCGIPTGWGGYCDLCEPLRSPKGRFLKAEVEREYRRFYLAWTGAIRHGTLDDVREAREALQAFEATL